MSTPASHCPLPPMPGRDELRRAVVALIQTGRLAGNVATLQHLRRILVDLLSLTEARIAALEHDVEGDDLEASHFLVWALELEHEILCAIETTRQHT